MAERDKTRIFVRQKKNSYNRPIHIDRTEFSRRVWGSPLVRDAWKKLPVKALARTPSIFVIFYEFEYTYCRYGKLLYTNILATYHFNSSRGIDNLTWFFSPSICSPLFREFRNFRKFCVPIAAPDNVCCSRLTRLRNHNFTIEL